MKACTPDLLVNWEPRWRSFFASCAIAMRRQRGPKGPGIPFGARPAIPLCSIAAHLLAGAVLLSFAGQIIALTAEPKANPAHFAQELESVIYFGAHLPEIRDTDGAANGLAGRAGSNAARADQVIKVALGPEKKSTIADAPALWLRSSSDLAANLVSVSRSLAQQTSPGSDKSPSALSPPPDPQVHPAEGEVSPPPTIDLQLQRLVSMAEPTVIPPAAKGTETLAAKSPLRFSAVAVPPAPADEARALTAKIPLPALQAARPVRPESLRPSPAAPPGIPSPETAALNSVVTDSGGAARTPAVFSTGEREGADGRVDVVMSAKTNSRLLIPAWEPGTLALTPSGNKSAAAEGAVATDRGHQPGTGAALAGSSTGGGTRGEGFGSNEGALRGIAPGTHTGGTGDRLGPRTGITIVGSEVYLPSFGRTSEPSAPGRAPRDKSVQPSYVVMASPSGGGGLNPRFAPAGNRVYTIYLRTRRGSTVLQFADRDGNAGAELTPPAPISMEIPAELRLVRMIIGFVLDSTGRPRDFRVVEAQNATMAAQAITALSHWVFRPALRGDQPLAVNAVIGFGVNTN